MSSHREAIFSTQSRPGSIHVVINPAPAKRTPLLAILNSAFRGAGIKWDVSITQETGDGTRFAQEAVARGADVVAAYGGDGTVMDVAAGLVGTDIPLLILGGGTGNLVASELRLPTHLERTCDLVCGDEFRTRRIDVGMMGDHPFLLRIGCGIEVGVVQDATRELKDQFGKWAYVFSGIKMLQETPEARYRIVLDGKETMYATGVACVVANVGTVGVGRLTLAPSVDVDDGRLDVFMLKKANIEGIFQLASKMMGLDRLRKEDDPAVDASQLVTHWSVETVEIETDPILDIQVDGDVVAKTPQIIRTLPRALQVVV